MSLFGRICAWITYVWKLNSSVQTSNRPYSISGREGALLRINCLREKKYTFMCIIISSCISSNFPLRGVFVYGTAHGGGGVSLASHFLSGWRIYPYLFFSSLHILTYLRAIQHFWHSVDRCLLCRGERLNWCVIKIKQNRF